MRKFYLLTLVLLTVMAEALTAQDTLPGFVVKNINNNIIVSWKNGYGRKIDNINIQRSYDSIKNFTTIGTVLNPMNAQNGFVDPKPVNAKMFYRVFIAFDGGDYKFTKSSRPVIDTSSAADTKTEFSKPATPGGFVPSRFVFTGKDNNVIINLPDAATRALSIKFYDDTENLLFELKKITEPYLIIEKVNFLHGGWFNYQLFDNGILLEKYKFYISKDLK